MANKKNNSYINKIKGKKMTEQNNTLPSSVKKIVVDDKEVYLIGTAHVSKESVEDVKTTVDLINPDTICVELCKSRYKSIVQRDKWKKMDIFKIVKEKKALFLLAQLIMSSFYKRLGEQLDVKPGAEMFMGIDLAKEKEKELVLADRNIEITLKRVWGYLNFWNKAKMAAQLFASILVSEEIDEKMIEELKNQDQLANVLDTFAKSFPQVKNRLIDERDIYLAQKIREAPGKTIVAVVGAGHVPGICEHIKSENSLEPLMVIPPKSIMPKLIAWSIPMAVTAIIIIGFFKGDTKQSIDNIYIWVLVNGSFSALGALLAFAHPLTIIASFFAAPLTSLNPMIAAGWVSGLVQAIVKKPTVMDMENLPNSITTLKGFWLNPVSRILLVVALANLGSFIGTFVAGSWIAGRVF